MPISSNISLGRIPDFQSSFVESLAIRIGKQPFLLALAICLFLLLQLLVTPTNVVKLIMLGPYAIDDAQRFNLSYSPLVDHPFSAATLEYPQCRLRILGPMIASMLQIRGPMSGLLTWIVSLPAIYVGLLLTRSFLNANLTVLFGIILITLHPFVIANSWIGYQDGFAGLFVLLSMLARPWWTVALFSFLGMLADERCIAGGGLILCWHFFFDDPPDAVKLAVQRGCGIVLALILWAIYGWYQLKYVGLTPGDLASAAADSPIRFANFLSLSFWVTFRAGWVLCILGLWVLSRERRAWLAVCAALSTIPVLLTSLTVGDTSRVCAHALPLLFVGLYGIRAYRIHWLTPLLLGIMVANVSAPTMTGIGGTPRILASAPQTIVQYVIHKYVGR